MYTIYHQYVRLKRFSLAVVETYQLSGLLIYTSLFASTKQGAAGYLLTKYAAPRVMLYGLY